ncbi:MAG: DnaJ domain-containing protein [Acidobacteriota bacterium]
MKVNYYEILGVDRGASEAQIRQRFRELAREHHPDRYKGRNKGDVEKLFQTLTEAVNILTNPDRRRQHDKELPGSAKSSTDPLQIARAYLAKGVKAYNEGHFAAAREDFDMAVKHNPSDPKAFHYLSMASTRSPDMMRQAVQAIESAVQLEPYNPVYLKAAGLLCKRAGLTAKAERYLEDALKWDQTSTDVKQALAELRQSKGESTGRFRDLFKKG